MSISGGMGITEGEEDGGGGSDGGEDIDDDSDGADMDVDGDLDFDIDEGIITSGGVAGGQVAPPCEQAGGTLVAEDGGWGGAGEGVMVHAGAVAMGANSVGGAADGMVGGDQGPMAAGGTAASFADDVVQAARGQLEGGGQGLIIVPGAAARYYSNSPAASRPAVDNHEVELVERDGYGTGSRAEGAPVAAGASAAAGVPVAATEGAVGLAAQNVGTVVSMAGSGGTGGTADGAVAAPGAVAATTNNVAALQAAALRAARNEPHSGGHHMPAVTDAAASFFAAEAAGHVRD